MAINPGFHRVNLGSTRLNIRSRPTIDSLKVGELTNGDVIYVDTGLTTRADGYDWIQIHTQGYYAYIALISSLSLSDHERYHDLSHYFVGVREYGRVHRQVNNWGNAVELIQVQRDGAVVRHIKSRKQEAFRLTLTSINRVFDNSPFEQGEYYEIEDGWETQWIPRFWLTTQEHVFEANIVFHKMSDNSVTRRIQPFRQKFSIEILDTLDFRAMGFLEASGVLSGPILKIVGTGDANETAFYRIGDGLVAWHNHVTGNRSWFDGYTTDEQLTYEPMPWIDLPDEPSPGEDPQPEPEPEEPDMPQLDIEVMESHQDYIQRWANPRFVHDENWPETRLPQGDPGGVIISYPSDWGFFIEDASSQARVAQTLNAGSTELKMDIAQKLIYQGPEKVASQLQLTWPGTYLFLWRVGTLISVGAQNLQYGLRVHMADGTVYGFSDHPGETRLFPTFNGQDHSGVWGLLVNIPEPQNVESVGLLARTNAEGVQGEMFWRYINAFKAPPGVMPADLGINVGIIDIPATGEPTPEPEPPGEEPEPTPDPTPEPTPSGVPLADFLRSIGTALVNYADDVENA